MLSLKKVIYLIDEHKTNSIKYLYDDRQKKIDKFQDNYLSFFLRFNDNELNHVYSFLFCHI